MSFSKPDNLDFVPVTLDDIGNPIPPANIRYLVVVDGVDSTNEQSGADIGGGMQRVNLSNELPDVAGNYNVALKAKDIVADLVGAASSPVLPAVVLEVFNPPAAPTGVVIS